MKSLLQDYYFKLYFIIFCVFLFTSIYFDSRPLVMQLISVSAEKATLHLQYEKDNHLIKNEDSVTDELHLLRKKMIGLQRFDQPEVVAAEWVMTILRASELNGVLIYSIQPGEWQFSPSINTLPIHILAASSFLQFIEFLQFLTQYSLPLKWSDFSFCLDKNGMGMIDLQLIGMYVPVTEREFFPSASFQEKFRIDVQKRRDPFEIPDLNLVALTNQMKTNDLLLQSVPLQQMEWVGYLHDEDHFWALARMPNGSTLAVSSGMQIGLESAHVMGLDETKVVLSVGHREIKMRYTTN